MRANAPFLDLPALLRRLMPVVLLGLLPIPSPAAPFLRRYIAAPTPHRAAAPAASHAATHTRTHKHAAAEVKRATASHRRAHPQPHPVRATAPADRATAQRVHSWVEQSGRRKPVRAEATPAASPKRGKATSADFLRAANVPVETSAAAATAPAPDTTANATTGVSNPSQAKAQEQTQSPGADPAKPVSVVSTIRSSGDNPQLPSVEDAVAEPVILPTLYNKRGRLVVPPPLKGSHEILVHQNQVANDEGLDRVRDDADLERMRGSGLLVAIPASATLRVDERLPANRRYCRPWTALFLDTLARQHYAHFQTPLQVNSAVRTVEFQQRLIHTNGNAAPADGDTASPHLTGQAIDIAKHGLSMAEIAWLRGYLLPLVQQGKVDVEEEFQQSCFHISVYKKYLPQSPASRRVIATTHREGMTSLGTGLN
jgi:hypothetical protein